MTSAALVVYGPLEQRTGGYLYDALMLRELRARGRSVAVVAIEPGESPRAVAARARATGAAVVVCDELCHPELVEALPEIDAARVLLVHHLVAWEPGAPAAHLPREAACVAAADLVVATSEATRDRLARELAPAAPVVVVEPGADRLPARPRAPSPAAAPRLLFVGALGPRKRVLELVDAAAEAGVALAIAGEPRDAAYAERVRARARETGAEVLGALGDDALADALATADALVLPSSLEGYGMVVAEALAAGVPVIVTRAAAVVPALAHEENALVVDEGGLASALARFAGDRALRERLAAGAAATRPRLPTWARAASELEAALDRAVTLGATRRARTTAPRARA